MNRYFVVLVASLFVLFGSLVTVGATARERDEALRGVANAALDSDLPYRIPRFGVNADLTQYDDARLATQLDRMQSAHVRWIRQFFRWDEIAPTPDVLDWSRYDRVVQAVAKYPDIKLVAVLFGTPTWARDSRSPQDATTPPASVATFAGFAHLFAAHYGDSIDAYQISDEPNLESAWGGLPPQPVDYLALLDAAYKAIHGVAFNATVIAAALAPTTEDSTRNISDWHYLTALYDLGGASAFDAAAGKPYGFDSSPEDRTVDTGVLNFSRFVTLREIMDTHGDGHKPLWASDWGWNALPPDWTGSPSIWGSVTPDQQIDYTLSALSRADQEWAWLGGMILHQWQPNTPCDDPQWGFAIIDCQDAPTALYTALTGYSETAQNGLYFPTTPSAQYSGVWTFSPLGADIGWVQDSRLSFNFTGSAVSLLLREDDYSAFLYASVDGQPANALPHDSSGRAYVNLTSGTRKPEMRTIPIAQHLGGGTHTLEIIADRGWDRWALAGFGVGSENPAIPYQNQIAIATLTAFIGAVGTGMALWRLNPLPLLKRLGRSFGLLSQAAQLILSAAASVAVMLGMLLTWNEAVPNIFRREQVQLLLAIATAGVIYLQPHIILLIASLIILAFLLYHRPQYGLLLTLFYAPFFLFPVKLYQFGFPMSELIVLLTILMALLRAFVIWAVAWRSGDRNSLRRAVHLTPLDLAMAVWLALGVISLLWANIPQRATTELRVLFVEPLLFYLLLRVFARDRAMLVRLIDAMLFAGIMVSVIGLVQYVSGTAIITAEDGAARLASVYGSPNNVALFLGRCFPFALSYALLKVDNRRRIAAIFCVVLFSITILLTQSAGALFLGIPLALAAVLLLVMGRRAMLVIIGLGAAGAAIIPFALRSARFQRLLDFSQGTNFFRLRVWESALNMIADHPITGIGLDQFLYAYRDIYLRPDAWQEPDLSHPHNFLLDIWLRLGIAGVMLFAWIQVTFWRGAFFLYRQFRKRDVMLLALIIGAMGSMVNLLAHGLVDNSFFVFDLSYVFVLLLAIISNIRAIDVQPEMVV